MKRIDFFYVEAGGGHRSAAQALDAVIRRQQRPWSVRLVNINDILAPLDVVKKTTGLSIEDTYNLLLKKGWTWRAELLLRPLHKIIEVLYPKGLELLKNFWGNDVPDLAVSLIPHFNRLIPDALAAARPDAKFVTVITDFADIHPRVWIEKGRHTVICGTRRAVEQAYAAGFPPERVIEVSGMILRPHFYNVEPVDREVGRRELGLEAAKTTGIVLFGGEGSEHMVDITKRLASSGLDLQLILMCGRNEGLGRKLAALPTPFAKHVQGFTSEVPRFMQLSDFLIGKPGPGSISEALAMKLPVIVDCNSWTMPQERYNAAWVLDKRVGMVVPNFRETVGAVRQLMEPGVLPGYQERAAAVQNRAVFEIVDHLERMLEG